MTTQFDSLFDTDAHSNNALKHYFQLAYAGKFTEIPLAVRFKYYNFFTILSDNSRSTYDRKCISDVFGDVMPEKRVVVSETKVEEKIKEVPLSEWQEIKKTLELLSKK